MDEVSYEDFAKLEIRIGKVLSAEPIEESEKLMKIVVDFDGDERQVIAGIKKHYSPDDLVGNKFVFVTNLQRRKIMGLESQAMILAAEDENNLSVLKPQKDVKEGSRIK